MKFEIKLPHVAFHRQIGEFAKIKADMDGNMLSDAEWEKRRGELLPSDGDRDYIESLMQPQSSRASSPAGLPRRRSASTTSPATSNT